MSPVPPRLHVLHTPPRRPRVDVWEAFALGLIMGALGMWAWIVWGPWWSLRG